MDVMKPIPDDHPMYPTRLSRTDSTDPTGQKLLKKIADVKPAVDAPEPLFVFTSRVNRVYQRTERRYISGSGQDTKFREVNLGWYLSMEGSFEAIYCGHTEPAIRPGDQIRLTFTLESRR